MCVFDLGDLKWLDFTLFNTGVLELLEYSPPIVTEEVVKQFNETQKRDFGIQVT